jgi:hypothetical protein
VNILYFALIAPPLVIATMAVVAQTFDRARDLDAENFTLTNRPLES